MTQIGKLIALAIRTTRITIHHKVALGCPVLHLVIIDDTIGRLWTAMNIQYCRILLVCIKIDWL